MIAASERAARKGSGLRRLWVVLGVFSLLLCAGNVALLISGAREWFVWAQAFTQGLLGVVFLLMPRFQRRVRDRARRSVMLNRQAPPLTRG